MKAHNLLFALLIIALGNPLFSQDGNSETSAFLTIDATGGTETISRHIYGHFSEHLGHCIYGGYWVGYDSEIPNTKGIRNDVVEALRNIAIPNLRWPGGCFADEYHWMDGIGDPATRPKMVNTHWGGVTEDNSFGTHEFLELCEQLDTEPVICGNVGSGTVKEMSQWVEYLNFDGISPMADLRRVNGRESAWGVKYWGVGNENWGCGGNMTADFYADQYRRYATFCRNYGDNRLYKIAGGANSEDFEWTETLMKKVPHHMMNGISLHYYTTDWGNKCPATGFGEDHYFEVLKRCLHIEDAIDQHMEIMDKYDPEKRVALVFDEWGTWYDVEPGTNPGFLYQQNSMRDALVAGLTLNYLNAKCERVRMANIAQTINVLQALIFTEGDQMVLTPTYHIYDMYQVHHDATLLPQTLEGPDYVFGSDSIDAISASASLDQEGRIHLSLVNIDPTKAHHMEIELKGKSYAKVTGQLLSSKMMDSHNNFALPEEVVPVAFDGARFKKGKLGLTIPARSVIVLQVD
ncbi:MAG: alpha-N-arabinofuranosidase [Bacteroidetes bacterium]|nr:MAG: alpha-N-arabinofuranosidase [Bacteroidota bacterium]